MILEIGVALLKTLSSFLFSKYLELHYGNVYIKDAPFWYGKEGGNEICVSYYKKGDLTALDSSKKNVEIKLSNKLKKILKYIVYNDKHFSNLKPDERNFLNSLINDREIDEFVDNRINFKNIQVEKNNIFIRGCVKKRDFITFEQVRIKELSKDLSKYKAKKAFNELESDDFSLEDELK